MLEPRSSNPAALFARKLKKIMDQEELNWRSFADPGAIYAKWNASGTPTYYVIDHKGVIRYKWLVRPGPGEKATDTALVKVIPEAERDANGRRSERPAGRVRQRKSVTWAEAIGCRPIKD